jgi:DNA-binding response OmpR family regulator
MSGYTDQIMRHWDVLTAYIQKPFTLSDLLIRVRELLDQTAPSSSPAQDRPAAS